MPKLDEVVDSLNDENVSELKETIKTEAKTLEDRNRQLYSRAKKAEGFDYDKDKKEWIKKEKPKEPEVKKPKSDEIDDATLDFLDLKGFSEKEDIELIGKMMKRTGETAREILKDKYVKSKLEELKENREVDKATPKGDRRGSPMAKDTVDYWLKKGEMPPADNPQLRRDYVNAKVKKETNSKTFTDNPTG